MAEWIDGIKYEGDSVADADKNITAARIRVGTRAIGAEAFRECCRLTEVWMPDTVTVIGACAFAKCGRLASLRLSP